MIREVALLADGTLDAASLAAAIGPRTRLVAMGLDSNALGTVNDVAKARELTRAVGAWLLLDAVHYAPHFAVDVAPLDPDFLLCSAYKFYGPHIGLLYSRPGLLENARHRSSAGAGSGGAVPHRDRHPESRRARRRRRGDRLSRRHSGAAKGCAPAWSMPWRVSASGKGGSPGATGATSRRYPA